MTLDRKLIFDVRDLAQEIKQGCPALFPTDTLPALGVSPNNSQELWKLKKRPFDKPLILMGASKEELLENVLSFALEDAMLVAEKYWPGDLTIIVPAFGPSVKFLNKQENTIGLRMPNLELALRLLELTGPLATTSANLSGESAAITATEASSIFPKLPILGPVPWPSSEGVASTVISWQSRNQWKVLRLGSRPLDINWKK